MRTKINNDGITLIEILVTIAIISIVAIPFLNSFVMGMRINNEARFTADAEQTAQGVAEVLKTMTVKDIVTMYGGVEEADYVDGQDTYTGIKYGTSTDADGKQYIKGDANEKFYVSAELEADPALEEAYQFYANKNTVPVMNNLSDSNTILVYDKYIKNDGGIKKDGTDYPKYGVLNISCKYTVSGGEKRYFVKITADTYRGSKTDADKVGDTILVKQKMVNADEEAPIIYIVPALYDRYDQLNNGYSEDVLEINYSYDGTAAGTAEEKPLQIFLIQQNTLSVDAAGKVSANPSDLIALNDANIKYCINGVYHNASNKYPLNTSLVLYSNIKDFGKNYTAGLPATELKSSVTGRNTFNALTDNAEEINQIYQLNIIVRKGAADGEVAARLTTTLTK